MYLTIISVCMLVFSDRPVCGREFYENSLRFCSSAFKGFGFTGFPMPHDCTSSIPLERQ